MKYNHPLIRDTFLWNVCFYNRSKELQQISRFNRGFRIDAENFDLIDTESNNKKNQKNIWSFLVFVFKIGGLVFYRVYLVIFFSVYFLIVQAAGLLKTIIKSVD